MSFEEQIDHLEQQGNYSAAKALCASGATCQGWGDFDVPPGPVIEGTDNRTENPIWVISSQKKVICAQGDIASHLTLDSHSADPLVKTSESPFDVLDENLPGEEKIRKLIGFLRQTANIQFGPELAARLDFLYEAVREDPDEGPISPESLSYFIGFLQNTPNLKCPDVVLTPSNEIRAQWRTAPNRHFAVVFLPNGTVRYVIFTINPKDPDKVDRLSGITSTDTLMKRAEPNGVLDWAGS